MKNINEFLEKRKMNFYEIATIGELVNFNGSDTSSYYYFYHWIHLFDKHNDENVSLVILWSRFLKDANYNFHNIDIFDFVKMLQLQISNPSLIDQVNLDYFEHLKKTCHHKVPNDINEMFEIVRPIILNGLIEERVNAYKYVSSYYCSDYKRFTDHSKPDTHWLYCLQELLGKCSLFFNRFLSGNYYFYCDFLRKNRTLRSRISLHKVPCRDHILDSITYYDISKFKVTNK